MIPFKQNEKGQAIYLIAFGIVALVGFTALSIDGGRILSKRRNVQNAADNAALAGALAKCSNLSVTSAALNTAGNNGYSNDGTTNTITINQPPGSGPYSSNTNYVEVLISADVERAFSQVVFGGNQAVEARAVAYCRPGFSGPVGEGNAIIGLTDTGIGLNAVGNGDVYVYSGGIHVNSSSGNALTLTGNGDVVADTITAVGGYVDSSSTNDFLPTPITGSAKYVDPLDKLEPPENPYSGPCINFTASGHDSATISPGKYCSITVSLSADLYMEPGLYVVDGGNFTITSSGDITSTEAGITLLLLNGASFNCAGNGSVTLVNTFIYVESGSFTVAGNGNYDVQAPTSGPWSGMMLFMDQDNTSAVKIVGNGSSSIGGTIYAPESTVTVEGNGGIFGPYTQIISNDINVAGNGEIAITYDPANAFQFTSEPEISLVE